MFCMLLILLIWNVKAWTFQINTPNHGLGSLSGNNLKWPAGKAIAICLSLFACFTFMLE